MNKKGIFFNFEMHFLKIYIIYVLLLIINIYKKIIYVSIKYKQILINFISFILLKNVIHLVMISFSRIIFIFNITFNEGTLERKEI